MQTFKFSFVSESDIQLHFCVLAGRCVYIHRNSYPIMLHSDPKNNINGDISTSLYGSIRSIGAAARPGRVPRTGWSPPAALIPGWLAAQSSAPRTAPSEHSRGRARLAGLLAWLAGLLAGGAGETACSGRLAMCVAVF